MPTQRLHAWLDPATAVPGPSGQPRVIHDEGVPLPVREVIDMRGAGVTATDDEAGDRTVITIPGQTPWTQNVDAALHDLNSVGVVRFGPYTGEAGPDAGIGNEAGTLHILTDNGGSINIESFGNGRVMVSTDGTRRLVVHQGGNVGIGPSMNPAYKLDVQGDCNVSGVYRKAGVEWNPQTPWVADVDAAGKNLIGVQYIVVNNGAVALKTNFLDRWGIGIGNSETGGNAGSDLLLNRSADNQTPLPVAVVIKRASGNVGIGTADPQYNLDVSGDINCTGVYRKAGVEWNPQTPWLGNISAGGYSLTGLKQLTVNGSNIAGIDAVTGISLDRGYGDAGDSMDIVWGPGPNRLGRLSMLLTGGGESAFVFYAMTGGGDGYGNEVLRIDGFKRVTISGDLFIENSAPLSAAAFRVDGYNDYLHIYAYGGGGGGIRLGTNNTARLELSPAGAVLMWLGGSLKTLSVDGSGFVKAA